MESLEAGLWAYLASVYPVRFTVFHGEGYPWTVHLNQDASRPFEWEFPDTQLMDVRLCCVSGHYRLVIGRSEVGARPFHMHLNALVLISYHFPTK